MYQAAVIDVQFRPDVSPPIVTRSVSGYLAYTSGYLRTAVDTGSTRKREYAVVHPLLTLRVTMAGGKYGRVRRTGLNGRLPIQLGCLFPVLVESFERLLLLGDLGFDLPDAVAVAKGLGIGHGGV